MRLGGSDGRGESEAKKKSEAREERVDGGSDVREESAATGE